MIEILLVEDEILHARLIRKNLEYLKLECHIVHVTHGYDAIKQMHDFVAQQQKFVVLLDLNLPDMHGLRILQTMCQDDNLQHIRVIVLSTSDDPAELGEIRALGYPYFMVKPPNYRLLMDRIEALWEDSV
ncbi:MAG: response regulator [Phototrophicaceae bacterium]